VGSVADGGTVRVRARGADLAVSSIEEQQLLEACRNGDPEALRRLVDANYDALYRFLWRLTASPEAAADLTQEVFVRALARLRSFDGRARFSTWLQVIALNLWKNTRRRPPPEPWALPEDFPAGEGAPCEQEALARLERREVWQALERLPATQRTAILLFYYEEMSYREIAQLCNCPVGTVGSWIHHGIRALRRALCEPKPENPPETMWDPRRCRRARPLEGPE
jgi:RNA polymerase sigma-70 factor, ECF subfamily